MAEGFRVVITERAEEQLEQIIYYLLDAFGDATAERAIDVFLKLLNRLRENPDMYPYYDERRGLRRALLRARMWVFFSITDRVVTITAVYSTYQNYFSEDVS